MKKMSNIFESEVLNKLFSNKLGKENFTLEDLKTELLSIVNPNHDELLMISENDIKVIFSLGYKHIDLEGVDLGDAILPEMNLECLELADCKVGECDFSKVNTKEFFLCGDNGLKNNGLSQFTNMSDVQEFVCVNCEYLDLSEIGNFKNLKQLQIRGKVANYYGIQNLQQLRDVTISSIKGVERYLTITDTLETIEIDDAGLTDIGFLRNYPNLTEIVLRESKLDESQLAVICELKRKGVSITFDESVIQEQLSQRKYEFEEPYDELVKKALKLANAYFLGKVLEKPINLNDYDIYKEYKGTKFKPIRIELEDVKILNEMINSGLLSNQGILSKMDIIEGIDFVVESLEDMTPEVIDYISKNKHKKFRFVVRTLNGLDSKVLEELEENSENIEFYVKGDSYHYINQKTVPSYECKNLSFHNLDNLEPYKIQDIKDIISVLEPIREQTMMVDSDLEKFAVIRKIAIMSGEYDYSGLRGSNTYNDERGKITRSLKGIFADGKAVCAGKSLGFLIMSEYVGLSARDIGGTKVENKEVGHAWNQIKIIDNDGRENWYNVDITNDPDIIGVEDKFILASDEEFYKKYKPYEFEKVEVCPNNLPNKYVYQASFIKTLIAGGGLNKILETEKNIVYDGMHSGKKITPDDIKKILSSLSLSEMIWYIGEIGKARKSNGLEEGIDKT